jgi:hypothetical protein
MPLIKFPGFRTGPGYIEPEPGSPMTDLDAITEICRIRQEDDREIGRASMVLRLQGVVIFADRTSNPQQLYDGLQRSLRNHKVPVGP